MLHLHYGPVLVVNFDSTFTMNEPVTEVLCYTDQCNSVGWLYGFLNVLKDKHKYQRHPCEVQNEVPHDVAAGHDRCA